MKCSWCNGIMIKKNDKFWGLVWECESCGDQEPVDTGQLDNSEKGHEPPWMAAIRIGLDNAEKQMTDAEKQRGESVTLRQILFYDHAMMEYLHLM